MPTYGYANPSASPLNIPYYAVQHHGAFVGGHCQMGMPHNSSHVSDPHYFTTNMFSAVYAGYTSLSVMMSSYYESHSGVLPYLSTL